MNSLKSKKKKTKNLPLINGCYRGWKIDDENEFWKLDKIRKYPDGTSSSRMKQLDACIFIAKAGMTLEEVTERFGINDISTLSRFINKNLIWISEDLYRAVKKRMHDNKVKAARIASGFSAEKRRRAKNDKKRISEKV